MNLIDLTLFFIGLFIGILIMFLFFFFVYLPSKLNQEREDAIKRSKAILSGQTLEHFVPYFKDFPYSPSEAKFLGRPIDFVVFEGLDNKKVQKIIFVEIKSGNSLLNPVQKSIKEVVEKRNIEWFEFFIKK